MKRFVWILVIVVLAGCSSKELDENDRSIEKIANNLEIPWAIASDGENFFITERNGTIVKIKQDGTKERQRVRLSKSLSNAAEAGLLGFVLQDDFSQSKSAYAFYTYDENGKPFNRIVTLTYDNNAWHEKAILLDAVESGSFHHGGRLALSPEGVLYATIGDGSVPNKAQNPTSFNGKILKLEADGTFTIFSLGHRNPQGLAWDEKGNLYSSEHGPSANDELNRIIQGGNYGWPLVEGQETLTGTEAPLLTSGNNETWAPSGMIFHKGLLYVAALRGEAILVIDPENMKVVDTIEGYGRIRDVYSDGDSLFFISNNTDGRGTPSQTDDSLYKIDNNPE